jgi:hypothetical protein
VLSRPDALTFSVADYLCLVNSIRGDVESVAKSNRRERYLPGHLKSRYDFGHTVRGNQFVGRPLQGAMKRRKFSFALTAAVLAAVALAQSGLRQIVYRFFTQSRHGTKLERNSTKHRGD